MYDYKRKRLVIEPFQYSRPDYAKYVVRSSNQWIRDVSPLSLFEAFPYLPRPRAQNMSTSPLVEPPDFAPTLRSAYRFMIDNPDCNEYFRSGPREYRMDPDAGVWTSCRD